MKRNDPTAGYIAFLMLRGIAPIAYVAGAGPPVAGVWPALIGAAALGAAITLAIEHRQELR